MDAQTNKLLESTNYAAVSSSERSDTRRKKLIWLAVAFIITISLTLILCFFESGFALPGFENQENQIPSSTISPENDILSTPKLSSRSINIFNKNVWVLAGNRDASRRSSTDLDVNCWEFEEHLTAIANFDILTKGNPSKIYLTDINNFIHLDLLLYYEGIINKYKPKDLEVIFSGYQRKLSSIKSFDDFMTFLNSLNSTKFSFYTAYLTKSYFSSKLDSFENFFSLTKELSNWYIYLNSFRNFLLRYEQRKNIENYRVNITEKNFAQFTAETQQKLFRFTHTFNGTPKKFQEINEIISECTNPFQTEINGSSITFHNKVLLLSELKNSLNVSFVKNVYVFASHTIYCDEDLTLPGINLAIIAPNWVFLKQIKVNLSGLDGKNRMAESVEGQPGKPGHPGGNAGDFLGIGDVNERFLHVYCDGGKGGDGQHGAKGRDGIDYSRPSFLLEKPTCVSEVGSYKNPSNETLTHYKIFGKEGCGTPGKDGGKGGEGGAGGKIIIINQQKVKISSGLDGLSGRPGKGGEGGKGGRSGCYYEALDVNDEVLNPITTVKCVFNNLLPPGKPGRDDTNTEGQVAPSTKVNLSLSDCLLHFETFAGEDYINYGDDVTRSFFNEPNYHNFIYNLTGLSHIFKEYEMFETFDEIKFYEVLKNKIDRYLQMSEANDGNQRALSLLQCLVLGRILVLKRSVDYSFVDFANYLKTLKRNIENIDRVENYPDSSYLRAEIGKKLEKINENVQNIVRKLEIFDVKNNKRVETLLKESVEKENMKDDKFYKDLADALMERRIAYFVLTVSEIMASFINFTRNQHFHGAERLALQNTVARFLFFFEKIEKKKQNYFESAITTLNSDERQTMAKYVTSASEFTENEIILTKTCGFIKGPHQEEEMLLERLKNFSSLYVSEGRQLVEAVRNAVDSFASVNSLSDEGTVLIQGLVDELEHLIAVYNYIEWHELEVSFLNGLYSLNFSCSDCGNEENSTRRRIHDVMVLIQYKLALDAAQQKVFPFIKLERRLLPVPHRPFIDEALIKINSLSEIAKQVPICKNNHEAIFDRNSAVGEFYFWPNNEIRSKLVDLFRGHKIELKSNLINHHVLDKNFLRFKILRLDLDCRESGNASLCQKTSLTEILSNFKMMLTHSGFSYYNWRGESFVIISDEVTFDYSLKSHTNGEPEFYSSILKSFQNGDIILSPYTTWTVQLLPINDASSYESLAAFIEEVELRMTGTGTFIS